MNLSVELEEKSFGLQKKLGLGLHRVKSLYVNNNVVKTVNGEKSIITFVFGNNDGIIELTEWEPSTDDFIRDTINTFKTPSAVEQMLVRINLILKAVNPAIDLKFSFNSFQELIDYCKANFKPDVEVDIKLLQFYKKNATINKRVASLNSQGKVYVPAKNIFIGQNLTLTEEEKIKINQHQEEIDMVFSNDADMSTPSISNLDEEIVKRKNDVTNLEEFL